MFERIVFFLRYPLRERDLQRFGVETLNRAGFEVNFYDFTQAVERRSPEDLGYTSGVELLPGQRRFETMPQALEAIDALSEHTLVINLLPFSWRTRPLLEALNAPGKVRADFGHSPLPFHPRPNLRYRLQKMRSWTTRTVKNTVLTRLARYRFVMRPPDLLLWAGGSDGLEVGMAGLPPSQVVLGHALDYDLYLGLRDSRPLQKNVAVFLDEYIPFHPDLKLSGARGFSTAEQYYPPLRHYFDQLESNNPGLKVIVAAHPKSEYEQRGDVFGERPIIRGQTPQLVHSSRFVLLHSSTSINFPILWEKPLRFLTTDSLEASRSGTWINNFASALGLKPVNVSRPNPLDTSIPEQLSSCRYESFREKYIKTCRSEDLPLWDIFTRHLRRAFI